MSIRNFPENPKIILRKSADQAKGAKNKNYEVAILICANFEDIIVLLRGATLKSPETPADFGESSLNLG